MFKGDNPVRRLAYLGYSAKIMVFQYYSGEKKIN